MKFLFSLLTAFIFFQTVNAQVAISSNNSALFNASGILPANGMLPVTNTLEVDLKEGSPFFQDNWSTGKIVTQEGKAFQILNLKLNLIENKAHYKDSTGKEMVIGAALKEIQLQTAKGDKLFVNGNSLPKQKQGWFLLLVNDTLTLLKGFKKTVETHTSYGSAPEYSIKTLESYFVYLNNVERDVKKPQDFVQLLPSKKAEIETEIKRIGSKVGKDELLTLVALYCNQLLHQKLQ